MNFISIFYKDTKFYYKLADILVNIRIELSKMKAVIIAVLLVASTLATRHPVNHEIVNEIKQMKTTRTPMVHSLAS